MKTRELAQNVVLALGASALAVLVLEGGARLLERKRPPRPEVADYIWDWDDQMPGGFYVMRSDGVGWPPWEQFNGEGLRDRTRSREKPEGFSRTAFLGDSVTLGAELAPSEAYPQLIEARYVAEGRRGEVMNVALMGWSTRQQRIAWQRIVRHYRPDQAVLAVCLNDIPELHNNLARPPRWLMRLHDGSALVRLLMNAEGREIDSVERLFSDADSPRVREALGRFFEEVRLLRSEVEAEGASFAVVVLPFRFQVEPKAPAPVVQQRIAEFCRSERIACLDLLPTLARAGPGAFLDYDHLSPSGAQLVADTLYASGLLAEPVSNASSLSRALAARRGPGAAGALVWLERRQAAPDAAAVSAIAAVLQQGDASERQAAAWALGGAGEAALPFVEAIARCARQDESAGVRAGCAQSLGALPGRAGAVALLEVLGDPSESVRAAAARGLARLGPTGEDATRLAAALDSEDRYVAAFAAWSLGNLGAASEPVVPDLARALARDETSAVVSGALARIGPAAKAAVPELVRELGSDDDGRRWRAARTLGRIGPAAAPAVAPLTAALGDASGVVRAHAARALGRIGPAALPAAAALQRATGDREKGVRDEARSAIERLRGRPD